ncbi:MAG: UDP-N-acetylglucosamine pyrophosphorylase [Deltaproteobacteria bacterium]|nr:UDP-N-acetylglucosamine pyrophosphorylase [Deltaproteobacteria bacterium]
MTVSRKPEDKISALLRKGVSILNPSSVEIGNDVDIERISSRGVVLHGGTKLCGSKLLIGPDAVIGFEGPATVVDCQLGKGVHLKGGFFTKSVFLDRSAMSLGAHVREACLVEEEASGAHTVGLKHTILFPFVTVGSLVNFCDCLMAGGNSRKNHSEVGSSYIHFNYTPNQDKATPSLIGDVPRGVMLRERPIFLGGQGGIVGPLRIGYGTVAAAGTILRSDCPKGGSLIVEGTPRGIVRKFTGELMGNLRRRVCNNVIYIANLTALREWYRHARRIFFAGDGHEEALYRGALEKIDMAVEERVGRLESLALAPENLSGGDEKHGMEELKRQLGDKWDEVKEMLSDLGSGGDDGDGRDVFLGSLLKAKERHGDYIPAIQCLAASQASVGTQWLQSIVDRRCSRVLGCLPAMRSLSR